MRIDTLQKTIPQNPPEAVGTCGERALGISDGKGCDKRGTDIVLDFHLMKSQLRPRRREKKNGLTHKKKRDLARPQDVQSDWIVHLLVQLLNEQLKLSHFLVIPKIRTSPSEALGEHSTKFTFS
ncbi:hypothetical protein MVEN_01935700 [Mycena venus]|uniref:Uncharacterized protein n=1 Tax=Mycena venus TaxID=2733690 RepID=A0A8H6XGQ7_9AGAR|nr:hypothetical protein MVEN_01935700 [Mycena venus]